MKVFKTERIIYFNAKYMISKNTNKEKTKTNNPSQNKIPEEKKFLTSNSFLSKKVNLFKVEKYDDYFENELTGSNEGRWTLKEHILFLKAIDRYGMNWKKIKKAIKTRTANQIRSHSQKFYKKLKRRKDEDLGIDFTLDSIHNMKEVINHIKSVNTDFDVVNVLLYMSEKCYNNKYSKKFINLEKEVNINNIFNDNINMKNLDIKSSFNDDEKEKNNEINEERVDKGLTPNNHFLLSNINFINNYIEILMNNYLNNAIITNIICNINNNSYIGNNLQNLNNNNIIRKDFMDEKILVNHPLNNDDN